MFRQISSALKDGMTKHTEAEVTFKITPGRLSYIIDALSGDNAFQRKKQLDLNYTKDSKNVYRITLDEIPESIRTASPSEAFENLLKEGRQVIHKHRVKVVDDLKISEEIPVEKVVLSSKNKVMARFKDRYTQIVYNVQPFKIVIDATVVSTGPVLSELKEHVCAELEVELTATKNVATIPKDVITVFEDTLKKVEDILEEKIEVPETKPGDGPVWKPQNKIAFLSWIYNTFKPLYSEALSSEAASEAPNEDFCAATPGKDEKLDLFPHQKFIRDYLQHDSPYRGLLLFHGLGVGKTCASIAAAEGFIAHGKKVVVMVPASLVTNYKEEITRCASITNPETKMWSLVHAKTNAVKDILVEMGIAAKLIKTRAGVWVPFVPEALGVTAQNKAWSELSATDQKNAKAVLDSIVDKKYTFISYNGLTSKSVAALGSRPFDNTFVVIDEAHNFISRVVHGSKIARDIYTKLMEATDMKIAMLSGTPIINHPFELGITLNLIRGPMYSYTVDIAASENRQSVFSQLSDRNLMKYINNIEVNDVKHTVSFSLYPENYVEDFDSHNLVRETWPDDVRGIIIDALKQNGATCEMTESLALAYPNEQKEFEKLFLDQSDPDNPRIRNIDMFARRSIGLVSYFKSSDTAHFPRVLPRKIEEINMADYQFVEYTKKRDLERKMESNQRRSAAASGVFGSKNSVYRAFSRMACNFVFPETMVRPFPKDLRKAAKREVDDMWEGDIEGEQGKVATKKELDAEYNEKLSKLMKSLDKQADTLLSPETLTSLYSPKMQTAYTKVATSPGKVLVYSQFRSIEGLGVFKSILKSRGYIEVQVTQSGGVWSIVKEEIVMKPEYDGKRFIVFDTDREKSKVLLRLFNNDPNAPKELAKPNMRGEFIKMIMVTQSGAEGISLKNVRRVIILEPFWNMVRMDQVIGRAVRTCSHSSLPPAEREVEVYILCSVFTPEQLKREFTLRKLDKSMSSDTHILRIAEKKDVIIQTFLNQIKASAVDCRSNAKSMDLLKSGMQCYAFPVNADPDTETFHSDINRDHTVVLDTRRKIRGRPVTIGNARGVQFEGKLYDYNAYKYAGVLEDITE